jgi:TRAP-type mannitol/chloroaromatic compound transport system substrate-binding protein
MENYFNAVNEMSAGRLQVQNFEGGAIVPVFDELDGVQQGTLEAMYTSLDADRGTIGDASALNSNSPAIMTAKEYLAWSYEGGGLDLIHEMYDRAGYDVHVVGPPLCTSAEMFGWANKPLDSLEAFDGLKFRTMGMWGDILTELGASVVTLPGGELYEALSRGVIDAFEYTVPSMDYDMGWYEIAEYAIIPGIHAPWATNHLIIGGDEWAELDDSLKRIVEEAAVASSIRSLSKFDYLDGVAMVKIHELATVLTLPEEVQEEVVRLATDIYQREAAEDPFFAKFYGSQMEFLKSYRLNYYPAQPDPNIMAIMQQ